MLDENDRQLLTLLQRDSRIPLDEAARELGVPKSTLHYRIKRLEKQKVIEGYYAKLSAHGLGFEYLAVVFVRAKYGSRYHMNVGKKLAHMPGVWAVYYVLGELDFVVLIRASDREDYMQKLETLINMPDVERTVTNVVARVFKEDPRIDIPGIKRKTQVGILNHKQERSKKR